VIAAVTGATGFVGRALVAALVRDGHTVRAFVRPGARAERRARLEALGAVLVEGDLGDEAAVDALVAGAAVVFHLGAAVGAWQPRDVCDATNLVGTEIVRDACRGAGVGRLVYLSCESVTRSLEHRRYVDETHPHPAWFLDASSATQALAEDLVVAASGSGIDTVVVRAGLVWGPDDTSSLVRLLALARRKALVWTEDGAVLVATTYIVNLVDGLLRAATRPEAPARVYYVTDDEMVRYRPFVTRLFEAVGEAVPRRRAWFWAALAGAWWADRGGSHAAMTRSEVVAGGRASQINIQRVRDELGYSPVVSIDVGMARTRAWAARVGLDAIVSGTVTPDDPER